MQGMIRTLSIFLFGAAFLSVPTARGMDVPMPMGQTSIHSIPLHPIDTTDKGRSGKSGVVAGADQERSMLAQWLDVPVDIVENLDLFRFIRDWYKTPYRFGGTQKSGIDCSAFTQKLYKEIYDLTLDRMVSLQRKQVLPVDRSKLTQGDLIFFHTTRPGLSHVGVYLGGGHFIHASATRGVVIDNLESPYYTKAFRIGGRMIDIGGYIRSLFLH